MSELITSTPGSEQEIDPLPPAPRRHERIGRRARIVLGAAILVVGIAGLVLTAVLLRGDGWWQTGAYALVVVVLFQGLAQLTRGIWGPRFDLTTWLCLIWVSLITLAAVLAPLLPLGEHENTAATLLDPIMQPPDLLSVHPLGTNNLSLDMLARVVWGARISLVVAIGAVGAAVIVGGAVGIVAGFIRGVPDRVAGILTNSLLAVPPLILLIALAAVLEPSPGNLVFALALLALPSMVRIARANTLAFAQREFVLAGRAMGASKLRLMFRELMPNVLLPLLSYAMVMVSVLIVAEASLSFLGLGTPPPTPTWGNMIAEAEGATLMKHPHIVLVPGIVLFLTVFSFNLLGEKARARFDPRRGKL